MYTKWTGYGERAIQHGNAAHWVTCFPIYRTLFITSMSTRKLPQNAYTFLPIKARPYTSPPFSLTTMFPLLLQTVLRRVFKITGMHVYKLPIRRPPCRDFFAQVTSWQHQRPPTQTRLITRWLIQSHHTFWSFETCTLHNQTRQFTGMHWTVQTWDDRSRLKHA